MWGELALRAVDFVWYRFALGDTWKDPGFSYVPVRPLIKQRGLKKEMNPFRVSLCSPSSETFIVVFIGEGRHSNRSVVRLCNRCGEGWVGASWRVSAPCV